MYVYYFTALVVSTMYSQCWDIHDTFNSTIINANMFHRHHYRYSESDENIVLCVPPFSTSIHPLDCAHSRNWNILFLLVTINDSLGSSLLNLNPAYSKSNISVGLVEGTGES